VKYLSNRVLFSTITAKLVPTDSALVDYWC